MVKLIVVAMLVVVMGVFSVGPAWSQDATTGVVADAAGNLHTVRATGAFCAGAYDAKVGTNFGRCPGVPWMYWWPGYVTVVKGIIWNPKYQRNNDAALSDKSLAGLDSNQAPGLGIGGGPGMGDSGSPGISGGNHGHKH